MNPSNDVLSCGALKGGLLGAPWADMKWNGWNDNWLRIMNDLAHVPSKIWVGNLLSVGSSCSRRRSWPTLITINCIAGRVAPHKVCGCTPFGSKPHTKCDAGIPSKRPQVEAHKRGDNFNDGRFFQDFLKITSNRIYFDKARKPTWFPAQLLHWRQATQPFLHSKNLIQLSQLKEPNLFPNSTLHRRSTLLHVLT